VDSKLDEVADRLAQLPLDVRHSSNRLLRRAEEGQGLMSTIAGVIGAIGMAISTLRRATRLPDQLTTRRLYEQAAGVDRDRANADLGLVTDRLSPLVSAPDGPQGDALVLGPARRLVAWVAADRTADERMVAVEAAFARWVPVSEQDDAAPKALAESAESYAAAWEVAVRRPTARSIVLGTLCLRAVRTAGPPDLSWAPRRSKRP
jgi:hypothetical protein